jgi:hypothetical protein
MPLPTRRPAFRLGACLLLSTFLASLPACGSSIPRRDPTGETFPTVQGESLERETIELPGSLAGAPAVLLLGYEQNTQFDLDRWILGLLQTETPVRLIEVPTIPGLVPGMISGTIDDGMRSGIPLEDWAAVVTLYGDDASRITEWTGTERALNGRILLLDAEGTVVWFHDRGYSATHVLALDAKVRALQGNL